MIDLEAAPLDRAIFYQAEKVAHLQREVGAAAERVNQGFGAEALPFFGFSVAEWLEVLEADLLAAECDLETLKARRGALQ